MNICRNIISEIDDLSTMKISESDVQEISPENLPKSESKLTKKVKTEKEQEYSLHPTQITFRDNIDKTSGTDEDKSISEPENMDKISELSDSEAISQGALEKKISRKLNEKLPNKSKKLTKFIKENVILEDKQSETFINIEDDSNLHLETNFIIRCNEYKYYGCMFCNKDKNTIYSYNTQNIL